MNRSWVRFPQAARSAPGGNAFRGFQVPGASPAACRCALRHIRWLLRLWVFWDDRVAEFLRRPVTGRAMAPTGRILPARRDVTSGWEPWRRRHSLPAERIPHRYLGVAWEIGCLGLTDRWIPLCGRRRGGVVPGLFRQVSWGSPKGTSVLSQFSSQSSRCSGWYGGAHRCVIGGRGGR